MTTLYLDRADALNAQNLALIERLTTRLQETDGETLLLAEGDHYSVGGDVKSILRGYQQDPSYSHTYFSAKYALDRLWQAQAGNRTQVQGYCLGGGMGLAMGSDHIAAKANAVFAMPEVMIGMVPDCGMAVLLTDIIGPMAELMLLTGLRLSAPQAFQLGLIDDLLDDVPLPDMSDWLKQADVWSKLPLTARWQQLPSFVEFTSEPSILAVVATYQHIKLYRNRTRADAMAAEVNLAANLMREGEFAEGITAKLLEKRPANFLYPEVRSVPPQMIDRLYG
ncbi:enoyl-CoA hydratase/isomerase family protein [Salinibius halmophilus]|uniref:enoyl-CoA hydratase/isomerase family protein n=1 Tax=Salinibius halmophilus TaxID=1853216 RepID=UPI000E66A665|nr:enoyl-CoA hydratase/isomerase family protein [Salinibius halmophilus]